MNDPSSKRRSTGRDVLDCSLNKRHESGDRSVGKLLGASDKMPIVGGTEKNGLPSIATKHYMVKSIRIVKAWFTSHLQKPAKRKVKSI